MTDTPTPEDLLVDAWEASTDPTPIADLTRLDLSTIVLALETHERVHIERATNPEAPAAIAARRTRAKVRRLLEASRK